MGTPNNQSKIPRPMGGSFDRSRNNFLSER